MEQTRFLVGFVVVGGVIGGMNKEMGCGLIGMGRIQYFV
jgi:hypothetical protein